MIRDLHRSPLGRAGLGEAIRGFLAEMARESDVRFHADIDEVDVPAPIALLLYRNAREGVMNALKHAKASNIWVAVEQQGDEVEMVLRDDGVGFDVEAPGPGGPLRDDDDARARRPSVAAPSRSRASPERDDDHRPVPDVVAPGGRNPKSGRASGSRAAPAGASRGAVREPSGLADGAHPRIAATISQISPTYTKMSPTLTA